MCLRVPMYCKVLYVIGDRKYLLARDGPIPFYVPIPIANFMIVPIPILDDTDASLYLKYIKCTLTLIIYTSHIP